MPGVAAVLRLIPATGMSVVVLSNGSWYAPSERSFRPQDIANKILQMFIPNYKEPANETPDLRAAAEATSALANRLVGNWQGALVTAQADVPLTLQFRDRGDVHLRIADQPWTFSWRTRLSTSTHGWKV